MLSEDVKKNRLFLGKNSRVQHKTGIKSYFMNKFPNMLYNALFYNIHIINVVADNELPNHLSEFYYF